jgi:hypothetical protein
MDRRLISLALLSLLGLIGTTALGDVNSGLVAWWRFEGNFNDSAGTNHGTPKGDAKIVTDAGRGRVVELDGNGDYVEIPNSPSLNITGDKISMAAWVRFNAIGSTPQIIIAKVYNNATHASPYFSYGLHMLANGQPRVWISRTGGAAYQPGATNMFKAGMWHHIAGVYDGAQLKLYFDGVLAASSNVTGNLIGYDTVLRLGINGGLTEPMAGRMDDVRIYNRALSAEEVTAVMQGAGSQVGAAADPHPAAGGVDVPTDTVLSWTAGEFAATHDVYFGETPADVNSASRTSPQGVLAGQGQTDTTYDPTGLLTYGQTYYWRIDEVNKAPDNTIFKGDIWSFTVEPYGYPVMPVAVTASSVQAGMGGPEKTIDGSGLDKSDLHGSEATTMWLSAGTLPNWIQYEFDKVYKLYDLKVWNYNGLAESLVGFGAKNVTIETSTDGTTWTALADVPEFARAPGMAGYAANTTVSLGGVLARYVKLTINTTWGGLSGATGLSEVRFSNVPVQGRQPQPAAAATGVSVDAALNWRPGREAVSHDVFFGTDRTAVADGTGAATSVSDHSFFPSALDFGTTYYWRVDEVNTVTYPGDVWSFTTQEYGVVDDFESYTDKVDEEIFTTWVDGFDNPTKNGAIVGLSQAVNGTFGETTIVYGDKQSMPFAYDNSQAPLSEATRTFDTPQDWSQHGITTLVLFFRGDSANAAAPLYVKMNGTKVLYNNGASATTTPLWKQWNIDLASSGANLKSVKSLTIGVGNGSAGEAGTIYIDDIRLYATPPAAAVPTDPGTNGLAAWWTFDGDFKDAAGTNHGTPKGDAKIVTDAARGQVLALDGTGDYVEVPNSPSLNITGNQISMAAWVNLNDVTTVQIIVCKVFSDTTHVSPYFSYSLHSLANGQPRVWISRTGGAANRAGAAGMLTAGAWHHVAGVYDGAQLKLYFDGALAGAANVTGNLIGYDTVLRLGANGALTELLDGQLDDVRIYNRALSEMEVRYLVGDR